MTFSEEILNGVMDAAAAHQNGRGADLVGINMEGPFISPNKVGAQNPEYLHKADVAMFRRLQKRANGLIKLVDIAPEEPGALEFIAACHDEVRISIAHTCTSYDTANAAFDAGATHMTHLYNAMPGITHREPGPSLRRWNGARRWSSSPTTFTSTRPWCGSPSTPSGMTM